MLAWSDKTGVEMFRYGDHIMGIQGHPEYTKDILLHLIDRLSSRELIEVKTTTIFALGVLKSLLCQNHICVYSYQ